MGPYNTVTGNHYIYNHGFKGSIGVILINIVVEDQTCLSVVYYRPDLDKDGSFW